MPRWVESIFDWHEKFNIIDWNTFANAINYLQDIGIVECVLNRNIMI